MTLGRLFALYSGAMAVLIVGVLSLCFIAGCLGVAWVALSAL